MLRIARSVSRTSVAPFRGCFVRRFLTAAFVFLAVFALASPARAELIRITPLGYTPAGYEEAGYPVDPVFIGADGFRLTYHGGGEQTVLNPVMLILAVPTPAEGIPGLDVGAIVDFTSVVAELGGTSIYGGHWNPTTGFVGAFDATAAADTPKVYEFIGFKPPGSDSQNYPNWTGATGLTSWDVYVYKLWFTPDMSRGDYAEFDTNLPNGSYVVGYGCTAIGSNGRCTTGGTTESTPFTFAGLVRVPEPGTLSLLIPGIGILAAGSRRFRFGRKN